MLAKLTAYIRTHHVGLIALVVAMTGTAVAATKVGPHDLAKNAVHSYHVKNGQLGARHLGKLHTVVDSTVVAAGNASTVTAYCPKSKPSQVLGLRTDWLDVNGIDVSIEELAFDRNSSGRGLASVRGVNAGTESATLKVTVRCLLANP